VSRVAILIAVDELRSEFPQVIRSDWLIAHRTERSRAGRPAIYQNESHVMPPCDRTHVFVTEQGQFAEINVAMRLTAQVPCSRIRK